MRVLENVLRTLLEFSKNFPRNFSEYKYDAFEYFKLDFIFFEMEKFMIAPKPRTAEQARHHNRYSRMENFFPIRDWPFAMQKLGMESNLNNIQRLSLWTFFVGNGMRPGEASENVLRNSRLSNDALRDVKNFEKMLREGKLSRYGYFDIYDKKYSKF